MTIQRLQSSTRNFNGFHLRLLHLLLGNCDSKNPILHGSLHLLHLHIFRRPEPPHELPAASLHPMPRVVLVFLLHIPLSADLEHSVFFDLHLHFLLLQPRKIGLEHVGFWGLVPVDSGVHKRRIFLRKFGKSGEGKILERVEDAASSVTEETWDDRHSRCDFDVRRKTGKELGLCG
jgi:hypothetical protein